MKAVWDWHMPRSTETDQRAIVELASQIGFDTLIIHEPTQLMMDMADRHGIRVVAIITPNASEAFAIHHPEAVQRVLPAEQSIAEVTRGLDWEAYTIRAHRWFPIVQMNQILCFDSPEAQNELKDRVAHALSIADGVAFDGFGFLNHYACFCRRCSQKRAALMQEDPNHHEASAIAEVSEETLVNVSQILYDHAKSIKADALVTNHLWPPFRPNPLYGCRLKLDFCSQTISWFYKPNWSIERVEFEAQEMKRLEDLRHNRFAPFIAMFNKPYLLRSADRIAQELAIAEHHGEGHLIFCNLEVLSDHVELRKSVARALSD